VGDEGLTGLGRRSALGVGGAAISGVATIGSVLIANHSLDASELGTFMVAISLVAMVQGLGSLGTDGGLQYFVPATTAVEAQSLVRRVAQPVLVLGVLAAVAFWVGAPWLATLVGDQGDDGAQRVVRAIVWVAPFAALNELVFGALRSCDRILEMVVLDRCVRPIAQVLTMMVVALLGGSATALTVAWAGPIALAVVAGVVLLARPSTFGRVGGESPSVGTGEFWAYTSPRALARVAQVLTQRLDVILLAAIGTVADAGVYGTVSRCMIAGVFVATAVQQTVQPRLRRLVVAGDMGSVKQMYGATTTWLVLSTWPVYLVLAIFAPVVLEVFGPGVVRGQWALSILCSTMLVASACGLVDVVLLMVGRSWASTIIVFVALAANVALNLILIPVWGLNGSAVAWSVSILITNLIPLSLTSRLGLHPWGGPLSVAILTSIGCIAVPLLVLRLAVGAGTVSLLVGAAIGGGAYSAAVWRGRRMLLLDHFAEDVRRGVHQR